MQRPWRRWLGALFAIALVVLAGVYVYDLGVAHGLREGAAATGVAGGHTPFFGWERPWGFGFFPFFPVLFILFWFVVVRAVFWRGRWWYSPGWRGRGWDDGRRGVPPAFEEWHRRAHDRQERAAGGTNG